MYVALAKDLRGFDNTGVLKHKIYIQELVEHAISL